MDVFDYAIKIEQEGEKFYRDTAKDCGNDIVKNILTWLAEEEVQHQQAFTLMKQSKTPNISGSSLLSDAKSVFAKLKEQKEEMRFLSAPQVEVYRKALELEKKSIDFYEEKVKEINDPAQKDALLKIAEEEKRHYHLLENIINFASRPEDWLENAEFNHLDEY